MDNMLNIKEVGVALNVSEITIRRWLLSGKIQHMKIGRTIRVAESEIIRLQKGV
jgi:excisionase family DNA binding protein